MYFPFRSTFFQSTSEICKFEIIVSLTWIYATITQFILNTPGGGVTNETLSHPVTLQGLIGLHPHPFYLLN